MTKSSNNLSLDRTTTMSTLQGQRWMHSVSLLSEC